MRLRRVPTESLPPDEVAAIRSMLVEAFADEDGFEPSDWEHALGGMHAVLDHEGLILAHAAVVARDLELDGRPVRTGYVEAVATRRGHEGRGHGSSVMAEIGVIIDDEYDLGALGTGRFHFYERLGWERWRGTSAVRTPGGDVATPDEDGWIMIRRTPRSPALDLDGRIACDWRSGDVW